MSKYLWQADDGSAIDKAVMDFLAGEDVILDRELFAFDVRATAAHVRGLARIGILTDEECRALMDGLDELLVEFRSGAFLLDDRYEDGHSAIEMYLTSKVGEVGAKVHTGRSRNDQVAVASRLYLKDALERLQSACAHIAFACLERAEANAGLAMPGYTHLQRAVPSSVGLWMGGFAEAFTDNLAFSAGVRRLLDCSPLGTAAGYGVNLPLDRDGVAEELGFERIQVNPMYAQNSRGKFEIMALQAAHHAMLDTRRLAWDLSLFTTEEFGFVRLPPRYTTGSSIMPNKANPDVVELLRGRCATVEAAITEIQSVLSLPSGYQRDLQLTKAPMIRGLGSSLQALTIVPALVQGLEFRADRMGSAISADMFATDLALQQASQGVPFRQAYREAKRQMEAPGAVPDPAASLAARVSPGGCGDLALGRIRARLERESALAGDSRAAD
ncbi:MAG: argininosuccinate lyase [Lysobacterales bacterium]|jgi:argininosuccinate lyase